VTHDRRQGQWPLPLAPTQIQDFSRAAFAAVSSNRDALAFLERWPNWPSCVSALWGPPGSGKSHLAHIWAVRAHALMFTPKDVTPDLIARIEPGARLAVDDAENLAAQGDGAKQIFHLINWTNQHRGALLLVGEGPPNRWATPLFDLRTRLNALGGAATEFPDDDLMAAGLLKLFRERQLRVAPGVISYLVTRMTRSLKDASAIVALMDEKALESQGGLTVELAARILGGNPPKQGFS
jgi:chromosomal replication initiation ATPase DnaA